MQPRLAEVADILGAVFPSYFHMGPAGNAGRTKLAINLILGLNRLALAEGLVFAERMGLEPARFLDVARQAASYSQVMDTKGPKMVRGDFAPEGRARQTLKDVELMLAQARQLGQDLPLAQAERRDPGGLRPQRRRRPRQQRGDQRDPPACRASLARVVDLQSPHQRRVEARDLGSADVGHRRFEGRAIDGVGGDDFTTIRLQAGKTVDILVGGKPALRACSGRNCIAHKLTRIRGPAVEASRD